MENKYLKYLYSNKNYYDELVKQYAETKGIKPEEVSLHNFKKYLSSRAELGKRYLKFLTDIGIDKELLRSNHTIEMGKGFCDSIFMEERTPIITPYFSPDYSKDRVLKGTLTVRNGVPILKSSSGEIVLATSEEIETYVTQNIYSPKNIEGWETLNKYYNIIVGAYGLMSDHNFNERMEQLTNLRDALTDATMTVQKDEEYSNIYYASVYSKRLIKK